MIVGRVRQALPQRDTSRARESVCKSCRRLRPKSLRVLAFLEPRIVCSRSELNRERSSLAFRRSVARFTLLSGGLVATSFAHRWGQQGCTEKTRARSILPCLWQRRRRPSPLFSFCTQTKGREGRTQCMHAYKFTDRQLVKNFKTRDIALPVCISPVRHGIWLSKVFVNRCLLLPLSRNIRSWRVQTQETIVKGNDFYTPHFTLPTNSPPTHQTHSILSYHSRTLYFDTKFKPSETLYFRTEREYYSTLTTGWIGLLASARYDPFPTPRDLPSRFVKGKAAGTLQLGHLAKLDYVELSSAARAKSLSHLLFKQ
jgi:hypothetical protein